jgi:ribosomal protein L37AE/L43A
MQISQITCGECGKGKLMRLDAALSTCGRCGHTLADSDITPNLDPNETLITDAQGYLAVFAE